MPEPLPEGLLDLVAKPSPCFIATLMPDVSPQLTQTWVTTDGENIVVNIVDHAEGAESSARSPRRGEHRRPEPDRYYAVRGRVVSTTTEGGRQSIDDISHKYLGIPYPNFTGKPETRVLITIAADSVTPPAPE